VQILVVNINGLRYTAPLLRDLQAQTAPCHVTLWDQGSTETGTDALLDEAESWAAVERHPVNKDLNRVWNLWAARATEPLLCFLNNDTRVPPNFVADTEAVFKAERDVGIVVHATNVVWPSQADLDYCLPRDHFVQGHDFTIRRALYVPIPGDLRMWGGDDWLFGHVYARGWLAAVVLSSPITHHRGRSHRFFQGDRDADVLAWRRYGFPDLPHRPELTHGRSDAA